MLWTAEPDSVSVTIRTATGVAPRFGLTSSAAINPFPRRLQSKAPCTSLFRDNWPLRASPAETSWFLAEVVPGSPRRV